MKIRERYFFCYSRRMSYYLFSKGFNYITEAKHHKNNTTFWLFEKTEKLQREIDNYEIGKKEVFNE